MWRRVLLFLALASPASATETVRVEVKHGDQPLSGASVIANGKSYLTDGDGVVSFPASPGSLELVIAKDGFLPVTTSLVVDEGKVHLVEVLLEQSVTLQEEITVVATTRSERGIEEQPMRVEVLGREEIEEKMLMTPGDIVMMLNEMGGMRVAATSPSLGAASVRIQGMRGRYTQFLSDGLPLYGEQPGGLALLQIPPMDLGRVEVIKGVASALYGGGAMGGVVNLLSRRPGEEAQREILVNASTRGATDAVLWISSPLSPFWSFSLLGSGHGQDRVDVDGDAWSDIAGHGRGVLRPRLFWDGGEGRSFFVTAGFTYEDRTGGTLPDSVLEATGEPYEESLLTRRYDVGAVGQTLLGGRYLLTGRVAVTRGNHDHLFGDTRERDRHDTAFAELTLRGSAGGHTWIAGAAFEHDGYRPEDVPRYAYSFGTIGAFFQDDVDVADWLGLSLSARLDRHNEYGTFLSPRFSALLRQGRWTGRVSFGSGFFAPTALTEETEAAGLTRLSIPGPLSAERGRSVSLDVSRNDGPLTTTLTLFASRIDESILVERSTDYLLRNVDGGTTNTGVEILATFRRPPFAATGTYTYVRSIESDGGLSRNVELTPRHSAGLVAMLEDDDVGRLGFELYFTGEQRLEANPYRTTSEPYVIIGILAERRFGRFRIFVNGENLTNFRQSRWGPLLRPERNVDGRWTVDAWAPLEGRVINGGVRVDF
ncbi:MAG TPA: TonB-dependent receptor [Vicinamibacteria bacterium]|nr:TonB-dependent receptor [Vicinamibacteria bacterium]